MENSVILASALVPCCIASSVSLSMLGADARSLPLDMASERKRAKATPHREDESMRFIGIKKIDGGEFIHRYDLQYELADGRCKAYEMISRRRELRTEEELHSHPPDAVVLIMYDAAGRILLNREFRMAVGAWVYSFPAGLIDPGETAESAATRELREETGLHLDEITELLPVSFGAVGISDESSLCVVGQASGVFAESSSAEEEIEAAWYTKEEVKALLRTELFAARAQSWCWLWCRKP